MTVFETLGVGAEADLATIKRAYARKLRTTRPDDDPEAFQALHQAYTLALRLCRQREERERRGSAPQAQPAVPSAEPGEFVDPADARPTATAGPSAPAHVDAAVEDEAAHAHPAVPEPEALCQAVIEHACGDTASDLQAWLEGCQALWSLQAKARVGAQVMRTLYRTVPPVHGKNQDNVLRFFDLDHALAGHDALALQRLRRAMHLAWEMLPGNRVEISMRLRKMTGYTDRVKASVEFVDRRIARLRAPYRRAQLMRMALLPGHARSMRQFILAVSGGEPQVLPGDMDRRMLDFWLQAGQPAQVTRTQLQLTLIRTLLVLVTLALGSALFVLPPGHPVLGTAGFMAKSVAVTVLAALGMAWLWMGYRALDAWQSAPEQTHSRRSWLRLAFIPLLAGAGVACTLMLPVPILTGVPLLTLAFMLSLRRLTRRLHQPPNIARTVHGIVVWSMVLALGSLSAGRTGREILIGLCLVSTVGFWTWDLWMHRHVLRVRRRVVGP